MEVNYFDWIIISDVFPSGHRNIIHNICDHHQSYEKHRLDADS
jgi:hypothetical protein